MSWGRGRGRGRGGGGFGDYAKQVPFEIFPEIELPNPKLISQEPQLVASYFNFEKVWKNSAYHLGDGVKKQENESLDIERYSDSLKPKNKTNKKGSFYDFLVLRPDNFPKDLLGDTRRERPAKRAKWNPDPSLKNLDALEKLEEKYKAEGNEEKEEEEDEDKEDESEESGNDDYDQNQDFDDDDDDYNQEDDNDENISSSGEATIDSTGDDLLNLFSHVAWWLGFCWILYI